MRPRSARIRPSASNASSTAARSPRPCGADEEVLVAVLGPPDRPAELERRERDQRRLDRDRPLRAERAAHVRHHDADRRRLAAQHLRQLRARAVRALRGRPHRDPLAVRRRERPARLHRHGGQPRDHALGADDVGGGPERPGDVARVLLPAHERLAGARIHHRFERLVLHDHAVRRVLGLRAGGGDHRGHRLTHVAHLAVREQRVRRVLDGEARRPRHVRGHRAARDLRGRPARATDRDHPCVRVRRADERQVRRVRQPDVIEIARTSGQDPRVLPAADRSAERARGAHGGRG